MPWQECSIMDRRLEFVKLAQVAGSNVSLLCERFGISRKTGYKWLSRYRESGYRGLVDQPRTPHTFPGRTSGAMEEEVVRLREQHPAWGGRKLHHRLHAMRAAGELSKLDSDPIPSPGSMTRILRRRGLLPTAVDVSHQPLQRFVRSDPNDLWQMDFKGDVHLLDAQVSHPLTILDDHSRFNLCLQSCPNQQYATARVHLSRVFMDYGMPLAILCDNGGPWGASDPAITRLGVWLMRLGVQLIHGRPVHPQTQGKDERFHRTLKAEVLNGRHFLDSIRLQQAFNSWRTVYNFERPHEALDYATPGSRYRPSGRTYPATLPEVHYEDGAIVRKVTSKGTFSFKGKLWKTTKALDNEYVAIYPTPEEGVYTLAYASFRIGKLQLVDAQGKQEARVRMYRSAREMKWIQYPCGNRDENTA